MKNFLALILITFGLVSCSKLPDNEIAQMSVPSVKNDVSLRFVRDTRVQDSLDKVFLAKYLDYTPLTPFEIDSIAKNGKSNSAKGITESFGEWPEYTDWSGLIHIKVFYGYTTIKDHSQILSVNLPSDWVLVGGGACTIDFDPYTENGAFIVESHPDPTNNNTSWIGKSKDHAISCMHNLYVYAIGMKITNYDAAELKSNMIYKESFESSLSDLPSKSILLPEGYLLVGGGAFDSNLSYGNMLIESYPNGSGGINYWNVKGKAHKRSAPSRVKAYIIGIRDIQYPGIGYLLTSYSSLTTWTGQSWPYNNYGPLWCDVPTLSGFALTCPGGKVTYNGWGRMFMEVSPNSLGSRDCYYNDSGTNEAYAVGIEKRPW